MTMPGFTAQDSLYKSTRTYRMAASGISVGSEAVIEPQFRSQVRRQCGSCQNGIRTCVLWGYECQVIPGVPGNDDLGIPGSSGSISCQPEVFDQWQERC